MRPMLADDAKAALGAYNDETQSGDQYVKFDARLGSKILLQSITMEMDVAFRTDCNTHGAAFNPCIQYRLVKGYYKGNGRQMQQALNNATKSKQNLYISMHTAAGVTTTAALYKPLEDWRAIKDL